MSERLALLCDIERGDSSEICGQLATDKCCLCTRDCCGQHRATSKLILDARLGDSGMSGSGRLGGVQRVLCDPCAFVLKQITARSPPALEGQDWDASIIVAARALVAAHKLKEST